MFLNVLIISGTPDAAERIRHDLSQSVHLKIVGVLNGYPVSDELYSLVTSTAPDIVFLDCTGFQDALRVCGVVGGANPGIPIIAVGMPNDSNDLLQLLRAGVREVLEFPVAIDQLNAAVANVSRFAVKQSASEGGSLYCFLPAKPGVGASIVALNTSIVLARLAEKRGLLCDLDLNAGISSFFLKLQPAHSIREAVHHSAHLDDDLWNKFTSGRKHIDVIGPGVLGSAELHSDGLERVIAFARNRYSSTCVDLSGNLEPWSQGLLRQATQIFLVCTHEIPVLHLARIKAAALREFGVGANVSILLNRVEKRQPFSVAEIEKMLGFHVRCTFRNDYRGVNDSTLAGDAVSAGSELGRQFEIFASSLSIAKLDKTAVRPKNRFLDFFSIAPANITTERKSIV